MSGTTKSFAFYGRVSTEDQQDPSSSRAWQLRRSRELIEPHSGEIVAEFFDIGQSRAVPWKRRPEASRLLAPFPRRGFEAVVIGEPHRAFYGAQFDSHLPPVRALRCGVVGSRGWGGSHSPVLIKGRVQGAVPVVPSEGEIAS